MINATVLEKELVLKERRRGFLQTSYYLTENLVSKAGSQKLLDFFKKNEYTNVGLYGAGVIGKILFDLLRDRAANIDITVIDQKTDTKYYFGNTEIQLLDRVKSFNFDIIVITPTHAFEAIKKDLTDNGCSNSISLLDVLYAEYGEEFLHETNGLFV